MNARRRARASAPGTAPASPADLPDVLAVGCCLEVWAPGPSDEERAPEAAEHRYRTALRGHDPQHVDLLAAGGTQNVRTPAGIRVWSLADSADSPVAHDDVSRLRRRAEQLFAAGLGDGSLRRAYERSRSTR